MENIQEKYELLQHAVRVADLSYRMAKYFQMEEVQCQEIAIAAHLHDIGKFFIYQDILNKKDKLTSEERGYIQEHSLYSYIIGLLMQSRLTEKIVKIMYEHHESYDGSGYPHRLEGHEMLFESHIVKICDVYDAMLCNRPYRPAMTKQEALREILKERQKYEPKCINALIKIENIRDHIAVV